MTSSFALGSLAFPELQERQVTGYGDRPFLTFYDDDRGERVELSYKTFDNWVHKLANLLIEELGVRRGERVATVTGNHWQASAIHFACWMAGACAVPVDVEEPPAGKANILEAVGARTVFVREEWLNEIRRLAHDLRNVNLIALVADLFGRPVGDLDGTPNFSRLVPSMPDRYDQEVGTLDDAALTILTSGSTAPAGVVLTQTDLLLRAAAIARRWDVNEVDRTMASLPAHDVDGVVTTLVVPFGVGAGAVLHRGFNPDTLWKRVADEKVSVLSLTSVQVERLLDSPIGPRGLNLDRLRLVVYEAGPPPEEIAARWRERFAVPLQHWTTDGGQGAPRLVR
ncbi:MAG TPA: TIGR03089 family protein [Actinomycetes bacterium]|nr:TIGR03089 family protein [Actinomycetes bacterium]